MNTEIVQDLNNNGTIDEIQTILIQIKAYGDNKLDCYRSGDFAGASNFRELEKKAIEEFEKKANLLRPSGFCINMDALENIEAPESEKEKVRELITHLSIPPSQ